MTGLESAAYIISGAIAGSIAVFTLLGKIVNQQVTKSFTKAIEGDNNGNAGLRSGLNELKVEFKTAFAQLNSIATIQAVMVETLKQRDRWCEKTHIDVDRRLMELDRSRATHHPEGS